VAYQLCSLFVLSRQKRPLETGLQRLMMIGSGRASQSTSSCLDVFDDMIDVQNATVRSSNQGFRLRSPEKENNQPDLNVEFNQESEASDEIRGKQQVSPQKVAQAWTQACEMRKLQDKLEKEERVRKQAEASAVDGRKARASMIDMQSQIVSKERNVEDLNSRLQQSELAHREELRRIAVAQEQAMRAREKEIDDLKDKLAEQAAQLQELEPAAAEVESLRANDALLRLQLHCRSDNSPAEGQQHSVDGARWQEILQMKAALKVQVEEFDGRQQELARLTLMNEHEIQQIAEKRSKLKADCRKALAEMAARHKAELIAQKTVHEAVLANILKLKESNLDAQSEAPIAAEARAAPNDGLEATDLQEEFKRLRKENTDLKAAQESQIVHIACLDETLRQDDKTGGHSNPKQKIHYVTKIKEELSQSKSDSARLRADLKKMELEKEDFKKEKEESDKLLEKYQVRRQRSSPPSSQPKLHPQGQDTARSGRAPAWAAVETVTPRSSSNRR